MKTAELTGPALDWAVANCEGLLCFGYRSDGERFAVENSDGGVEGFMPSTNWSQGGPIIEREQMDIKNYPDHWVAHLWANRNWKQTIPSAPGHEKAKPLNSAFGAGPTMLIAAMRCYVASKLGDKIELHECLNADD